jgi:hypothetical protein
VTLHLQLGSGSGTLNDGATSWNSVADGAVSRWSQYLTGMAFRGQRDSTAGISRGNTANNVIFSDRVYGDSFGDAIAVALSTYTVAANLYVEGDVIFNSSLSWNSYRGNLTRISGGDTLYDLRRVALHEFGHVLGLNHPDQNGQSVTAIMNSRISNTDDVQSDDINGIRAIYGSPATSNRSPSVTASCSPCTVTTGQTSTLRAAATDPDGDSLTYRWTAASGTFSASTASSTTWTAPNDAANVTVTITVQDGRGGSASATVSIQVARTDRLQPGTRLLVGESLWSTNNRYRLLYQTDGNLVLYDETARTALWATGTGGTTTGQAAMQTDGHFVIYDADGAVRFSTGTAGNTNAYLLVQNDGNVVIYSASGQPIWDRHR